MLTLANTGGTAENQDHGPGQRGGHSPAGFGLGRLGSGRTTDVQIADHTSIYGSGESAGDRRR